MNEWSINRWFRQLTCSKSMTASVTVWNWLRDVNQWEWLVCHWLTHWLDCDCECRCERQCDRVGDTVRIICVLCDLISQTQLVAESAFIHWSSDPPNHSMSQCKYNLVTETDWLIDSVSQWISNWPTHCPVCEWLSDWVAQALSEWSV